jgi:hypothetical protein
MMCGRSIVTYKTNSRKEGIWQTNQGRWNTDMAD